MSTEPDATPVVPDPAPAPASRRLVWLTFVLAALVIAVDQLTKQWALSTLEPGVRTHLIGRYLGLQITTNSGAALGLGEGYTWVLTLVVIAVVVVIIRVISKIRSRAWAITLGLLLGGALGNLADRLFREPGFLHGHVIDFIAYWNWFIGNVADIAIVVAAVLLALLSLLGFGLDGTRESHPKAEAEAAETGPEA